MKWANDLCSHHIETGFELISSVISIRIVRTLVVNRLHHPKKNGFKTFPEKFLVQHIHITTMKFHSDFCFLVFLKKIPIGTLIWKLARSKTVSQQTFTCSNKQVNISWVVLSN